MNEKKNYREELFYKQKNGYDLICNEDRSKIEPYCTEYMEFLNNSRTEREAVRNAVALAEAEGFREYKGGEVKAGDKIYYVNRNKALILAVIGEKPLSEGMNISAAHIDSPRLDLKQNPLYEDTEMAFFKTHYYGGIKKYQWTAIPLELHGVVSLKSGENVDIVIGREPGEPRFFISDLLPHLAKDQMTKTMADGITGEGLNILIGSVPYDDEGEDRVKLAVMSILNSEYGITEEDFISAELCVVPAFDVVEIGFDRSMIGGYGHDDRVCSFAALRAILDIKNPVKTAVCILADKEEVGSNGVSGMQSQAFEYFVSMLCEAEGCSLHECFSNSFCLSSDVTSAFDPNFPDVYEKKNSAKLNYGIGINKYTGARGKSSTSDASSELVAFLRRVFERDSVLWQMCEIGKVDQGGGGTVAVYMANRNIDTIDAGVPVLAMHAPFELVSKLDCYMTYKANMAIFNTESHK